MSDPSEEDINSCVRVLISDYMRVLSDPVEYPPTFETKRRLKAFWELFDYYLTAKQKEKICKWWQYGDDCWVDILNDQDRYITQQYINN